MNFDIFSKFLLVEFILWGDKKSSANFYKEQFDQYLTNTSTISSTMYKNFIDEQKILQVGAKSNQRDNHDRRGEGKRR